MNEPPVGARVVDPGGHSWTHCPDGWVCMCDDPDAPEGGWWDWADVLEDLDPGETFTVEQPGTPRQAAPVTATADAHGNGWPTREQWVAGAEREVRLHCYARQQVATADVVAAEVSRRATDEAWAAELRHRAFLDAAGWTP